MKSERGSYEAFLRGAHQPSPPSPPLTDAPTSTNSTPRVAGDGRGASAVPGPGDEGGGRGGKVASVLVQSNDTTQSGSNSGLLIHEGPAANEIDGTSQGESIQTMHRILTQGIVCV